MQSVAFRSVCLGAGVLFCLWVVTACETAPASPLYPERIISMDSTEVADLASRLRGEVNVEVDEGLALSLWAVDSLVTDPIALSIAPDGRVFYTSATRQANSEFDIRGHRDWMTASISFQTVEDRRAFLRETFSQGSEASQVHLKDLNEDGVKDWRDLTVEKEQVWFVTDTDADGVADRSQLYLEDFGEEITDVANGLEYHNGELFLGVGPDLWRMRDQDEDGRADEKESLAHGFAVHIGFGGHGMSGVTVGPLGRIWWGIGDIGMNLIDQAGKQWKYPNRGVVVRAEPDGSNFEVFAMGMRNTHEFVFDDYGNLITIDNDGDHRGERERLVYLIDGSDTGWRINWQFGKYSDPLNNTYKVWMDEGLHLPRWEGQPAYILPPIQNYVNGPTGMLYNPGTALSPEWYDHFFVAEFRGSPSNSPIHAFRLQADGAGFALKDSREIIRGVLPTGLDFSADGSLYFGDWINGWGPKEAGRIWKLDVPGEVNSAIRQETQGLLGADFAEQSVEELGQLLGHQDQRVRRKAQFSLVERGRTGQTALLEATQRDNAQLARIHGMWGLAQLARQDAAIASELETLLADADREIVAQAARLLGDLRYAGATETLIALLEDPSPRVRFFAMEALGRKAATTALPAIVELVRANNDEDNWLRAGSMIALGRIGAVEPLVALQTDSSRAVRTVAVVALRRMAAPEIAVYLADSDEYIATEAARGINDDFSIEAALPELAKSLEDDRFVSEPFLRRAINANLRVGGAAAAARLVAFANRPSAPLAMRAEALLTLASWGSPSLFDRVDGRYRGELQRDSVVAGTALLTVIDQLLAEQNEQVLVASLRAVGGLGLASTTARLVELLTVGANISQGSRSSTALHPDFVLPALTEDENLRGTFSPAEVQTNIQIHALNALHVLKVPDLDQHLATALASRSGELRARALEILPESSVSSARAVALYAEVLTKGTELELQAALQGLGAINDPAARALLEEQLLLLEADELPQSLQLDLVEAIELQSDAGLNDRLATHGTSLDEELRLFATALEGGNARLGEELFYGNESAQCVRCHAVFEYGGNVGPGLAGIADQLSRRDLLLSVVRPSHRLAPGYETLLLTLSDSSVVAGTLLERSGASLRLQIGKEEEQQIALDDILEEESLPSSMPSMDGVLSRRQIRDLVAFLASLKAEES
ncbi:MAG: HEAT repeat domain-containing protein [Bacteroidota bacterium]